MGQISMSFYDEVKQENQNVFGFLKKMAGLTEHYDWETWNVEVVFKEKWNDDERKLGKDRLNQTLQYILTETNKKITHVPRLPDGCECFPFRFITRSDPASFLIDLPIPKF